MSTAALDDSHYVTVLPWRTSLCVCIVAVFQNVFRSLPLLCAFLPFSCLRALYQSGAVRQIWGKPAKRAVLAQVSGRVQEGKGEH